MQNIRGSEPPETWFTIHPLDLSMYVEQEMYSTYREVSKIIWTQKYNNKDGFVLTLGPYSFRILCWRSYTR